jgi:hypothetical protein
MSTLDAAFNVVHDYAGGASSLAPRLNMSSTYLSNQVTGTGTSKLGLLDAEKITRLTGDLRILSSFANNCGQMLVPMPHVVELAGDDCMVRLADVAAEFGALCREVGTDLADGEISDNELARIDKECGLMVASVHALRVALAARNLANKDSRASLMSRGK